MERNKKTPLLLLLLQVCIVTCLECPSHPDENLACLNDFNHTITCDWKSASDHTDTACTLYAIKDGSKTASCELKPADISRPTLMTCSLTFKNKYIFHPSDIVSLNVSCGPEKHIVDLLYKPFCHMKMNPGKPLVNYSTISWSMINEDDFIWSYELQWKSRDEPWSNAAVLKRQSLDSMTFKEELDEELLIQGESYEARVRMLVCEGGYGPWSDWSPTVSWVSEVGRPKPPSDFAVSVWQMIVAGVGAVGLLLIITFFKMNKTWVYIVKRVRGPPMLNPPMSLLQDVTLQSWLHPYFTSESFHSFLKAEEFISVEISSAVDGVTPHKPEAKTSTEKSTFESSSSSFSNPSYSELCAGPPPDFPHSAGSLEACAADAPYGPVGCGAVGQHGGEVRPEEDKKDVDILKLLCRESGAGESGLEVVSDYEKAEKLQLERLRLQSLDSGVCSGEEVSQESMEDDSITGHGEDAGRDLEADGGSSIKVDFHKLLGSSSPVFGKGSILICSDYKAVEKLCSDPGLPTLDSSPSGNDDEQEEEEKSSESTPFLFPSCSILSQPPPTFTFSKLSSSSPSPLLMSAGSSVEPSGDGYMPVRQQQS